MSERVAKVGFIGLGRMGKPMASNVLNAGYPLTVYDVRDAAVGESTRIGAEAATLPRNVAEQAEIVEIAVVDNAQVEDVLTGEHGVFAGASRGTIVAIHSAVLPDTVRRLAEVGRRIGVDVIDAPASGAETGARGKSLCYMVGGDAALLERCREVFSTSASQMFHVGELGSGSVAKIIVQVATWINMLAAHEA